MEQNLKSRFVSALLGSLLAVGLAGAGMAYAQSADDTAPDTTAPAQEAPAAGERDKDCPLKDGAGPRAGGTATTPAPNADEA